MWRERWTGSYTIRVLDLACDADIIPLQSRIKNAVEPDAKEVYETERQLLYVVASVVSDVVAMSDRGGA